MRVLITEYVNIWHHWLLISLLSHLPYKFQRQKTRSRRELDRIPWIIQESTHLAQMKNLKRIHMYFTAV